MTERFIRILWLLFWGVLPAAFLPAAHNPFGPVKRDVFAVLAVLQVALMTFRHFGAAGRAAKYLAGIPVSWGICVWALWSGLVLVREGDPRQGYYGIVESMFGAATALGLLLESAGNLQVKALWCCCGGVALAWGYGFAQISGADPFTWQFAFANAAPGSTFGNPLFFADGLLAAMVILVVFSSAAHGRAAGLIGVSAGLIGAMLILTHARGAWIGSVAGVGVGLALLRGCRMRSKLTALVATMSVAMGGGILVASATPAAGRPALAAEVRSLAHPGREEFRGRRMIWEATARLIVRHPIGGWGVGGIRAMFTQAQAGLLREPRYRGLPYRTTGHAHQDLLQIGAERGLIGVGIFMWMVLAALRSAWRAPHCGRVAAAAGGVTAGWLVDGLFNGPLHLPPSSAQAWWFIALAGSAGTLPGGVPARGEGNLGLAAKVIILGGLTVVLARPFVRDLISECYAEEGQMAFEQHLGPAALQCGLSALAMAQEDRRQHFFLGQVYAYMGQLPNAVEEFETDVAVNPGSAAGWENLAQLYRLLGRSDEARLAVGHARELAPDIGSQENATQGSQDRPIDLGGFHW